MNPHISPPLGMALFPSMVWKLELKNIPAPDIVDFWLKQEAQVQNKDK